MGAVFITATGTEIGKTFLTAGLIRHWRAQGVAVEAIKPVISGYDPEHRAESDPGILLDALGRTADEDNIARLSPWRYRAAVSPDLAAAREGQTIEFNSLVEFTRIRVGAAKGMLLIEGIGGVMVPLEGRRTVLDWMTMLRAPVVLVTGNYLGTLSHTLTAMHVLAQRKLEIAAIVVSECDAERAGDVSLSDTVAILDRFAEGIPVIGLPRVTTAVAHPAFAEIAHALTG